MDYSELANVLTSVAGQNVYLRFSPEILDFTNSEIECELQFFAQDKEFKIVLKDSNLPLILQFLKLSIFAKNNKVVVWDWKTFCSYVLGKTKSLFAVDAAIIDLKILEYFSGTRQKAPKTLTEAFNRLKNLISSGIWKEVEPVYKKLHLPLITTVIPHLETAGINDTQLGKRLYAYYEIEGQRNGRLKCHNYFKDGYVPHAMKPETRAVLKPRDQTELFMMFDFKGMEVFMLAWMSQDTTLQKLCAEKDVYSAIFEKITGNKCENKNNRDLAKKMFLPVIYGQSAYALSQECGLAIDAAEQIVERIDSLFSTALTFVGSYQKQLLETGYAKDIFGRRRTDFEKGKEFSVRNFSVQSPASLVCLEKLTHLYIALKQKADIAYTVHDGYVVYANKENWKTIYKIGREVLSGESEFCPGLRLRVTCHAGRDLNDLKLLARQGE